ncbi:hypothetical protein, partial [Pyrobaculum aerophilum]|uniref:hypothetical protein n=1 Tax=Pyrobaculum aerophilum TaxID=13773 RepID=UPI0011C06392
MRSFLPILDSSIILSTNVAESHGSSRYASAIDLLTTSGTPPTLQLTGVVAFVNTSLACGTLSTPL